MSNVPLESTTHAILQHHLPLITPRVEFDFARLSPSAPVTARLDFDFLPEEDRASLFDPNDKGKKKATVSFARDSGSISMSEDSNSDMDVSDESELRANGLATPPSSASSAHSTSTSSASASSTVAHRHLKVNSRSLASRPSISPIAAAISPLLEDRTYSAPNIQFKKTYVHLREILAEFNWTNAQVDELIEFAKSVTPDVVKLGKLAFDQKFTTELGEKAEGHVPILSVYNEKWPFLYALAVACKLFGESTQRKEQCLIKKSKSALALTYIK